MTTDIMLAVALGAALILNAMQMAKANDRRNVIDKLRYKVDLLTRPIEDDEAVHTFDPDDRVNPMRDEQYDDWLTTHPGVAPKPGYERKRR